MNLITLNIETRMFIGILPAEKKRRNRVKIRAEFSYSMKKGFIDYRDIYRDILEFANSRKHSTLEEFSGQTAQMILDRFPFVSTAFIESEKLSPSMMPECKSVSASVKIRRNKKA